MGSYSLVEVCIFGERVTEYPACCNVRPEGDERALINRTVRRRPDRRGRGWREWDLPDGEVKVIRVRPVGGANA